MKIGRPIIKYLKRYLLLYIVGIAALLAVNILQTFIPSIIGEAVDSIKAANADFEQLLGYTWKLLIIALSIFSGRFMWRLFIFGTSRRIEYHLKNDLFGHLEKMSLNFYNQKKTGDMMALFTNDLNSVRMSIGPGILMLFDSIVITALVLTRMLKDISITLTILAIIPLPIIAIGGIFFGRSMISKFKNKQEAFAKLTDFTQESFSGIRVIKAFVKEAITAFHFEKINRHNMQANIILIRLYSLLAPIITTIAGLSIMITLCYGGYLTIINRISLGEFIAFNQYIMMLIWPMIAVGWCINIFSQGTAAMKRVATILFEPPEIKDESEAAAVDTRNAAITVNNLSFQHRETQSRQLTDINFHLESGRSLAIIGRTGAGKSTLIQLLLRLYNPPVGSIFINGRDIRKIPLNNLRELISFVPQDNFLFSDSIEKNITIGVENYVTEEMIKAAELANINHNILDFPDEYDTIVGERGVTLSGGQKQRISIARALLKSGPIIIFDDSLSAVDTATEEKIINNLRELKGNKTIIIIAHRLSTVQFVDNIIVLDKGRIIEEGNHEELLEKGGFYYQLYQKQLLEKAIDDA